MTNDVNAAQPARAPLTEDKLAHLVRDAAEGWQMPPVPMDRGGWAERARTSGALPFGRRRIGLRVTRAFALALALIVVAAATGVVLTRLRTANVATSIPIQPPVRSVSASGRPSASAPMVAGLGGIGVDNLLVRFDSGYAVVDVAHGTIGRRLPIDGYQSMVRQLDDGTLVCICVSSTGAGGAATRYSVEWQQMEPDGTATSRSPIGTFAGMADPETQQVNAAETASIEMSAGDGNAVYVGWSTHESPVWHSGIVAVDITTGEVLQQVRLPDRGDRFGSLPLVVVGPHVVGRTDVDHVLIDRAWYADEPTAPGQPAGVQQGFDAYLASYGNGNVGAPIPFFQLDGCGNNVTRAGTTSAGWWAACFGDSGTTIRRFGPQDIASGDARLPSGGLDAFSPDSIAAVDDTGAAAYAWNPFDRSLTKVDLATGGTTVAKGEATGQDVLSWLANLFAPTAAAKVFVTPAVALSPDGTRAYALGTTVPTGNEATTSTGVYVFDTAAMKVLDHWTSEAASQSIATSADGSTVFLAAGANSGGTQQWPSITAVDAETGTVLATVTGLGYQTFFFSASRLP
jgi:hypothetical protein